MDNKIILCAALAAAVFAPASCSRSGGQPALGEKPYTIEAGGSTSVAPLMELLAAEYHKIKPNIKININGTGSGDGIKNAGKLYQIGMSSRELTPLELGEGLKEDVIALDGIAVIVNPSNPVSNVSIADLADIYTGAARTWNQISPNASAAKIAVISREEGSGTRAAFEELAGFEGRLLSGANESTSTGAIKAGTAQNPDAIGYVSLGSLDSNVKAVSIDGVSPNPENVLNGSYKLSRPFILLTGSSLKPESAEFISWILSGEGQNIVKKSWIPVNQ